MRTPAVSSILVATGILLIGQACSAPGKGASMTIRTQIAKFAPVSIAAARGALDAREEQLVGELVKAADQMDEIFFRQVSEENPGLREQLAKDRGARPELYDYFMLNMGPWDRLDHDKPFVPGVGPKPAGATFYPADMTKEEFQGWIAAHPKDREAFESPVTVIRRTEGVLLAVPYSKAYEQFLKPAAEHLRKAAALADNASLARYLTSRADALLSNDYFASDVDWVRMKDHAIEVVIGPYEVYEDNLLGQKAAFEAYITRVDPDESRRLTKIAASLPELEAALPIEEQYKGKGRNLTSPLVVVELLYAGGEAKAGVATLAFNLPNDERVRKQEGSKKVMMKNVQEAKFEKILRPIAERVLVAEDAKRVGFDAFFAHTILHEMSHGIGPGEITKEGKATTVNKELKDSYSLIEECKADVLGVANVLLLAEKGLYPAAIVEDVWPTYLASIFRSVRFGTKEAHGGSNAMQLAWLLEKKAVGVEAKSGKFRIDSKAIGAALADLAHDLLMIEATGDYAAAKTFIERYRLLPPAAEKALSKLADVPVDIRAEYAYR